MSSNPGHLFHISRVWGSRHGGSRYSQRLVRELRRCGWRITLFAERFENEERAPQRRDNPATCRAQLSPRVSQAPAAEVAGNRPWERVCLSVFFSGGALAWPAKVFELFRIWMRITSTPGALVIVQGDLPRLVYLLLQFKVPLIFIRQDGLLTCPANNRFLHRSRSVCRKPLGLSCLRVHREEGCLRLLSPAQQLGRLAFRLRDALLLRGVRHFVGNSTYVVRAHHRAGMVLYPGHDSVLERAPHSSRDLRRLVFCGRLEAVKGAADALRILSLLPDEFHLEVLGEGPERGRLGKAVHDLQLGQRVRFRGWVDEATRNRCLAASGVLLLPSLCDEGFGMAGVEALAQGTPVVAYDVGGVSEWCRQEAGILVQCGDVWRAAMAVRTLTGAPERWAAYSRAARKVAEEQFPVSRFGRDLATLLAKMSAPDGSSR